MDLGSLPQQASSIPFGIFAGGALPREASATHDVRSQAVCEIPPSLSPHSGMDLPPLHVE